MNRKKILKRSGVDFGNKTPFLEWIWESAATSLSEATCWTNGSCAMRNWTCLWGWGGIAGLKSLDSAQRLKNGAKSGKMGSGFFPVLGHGRVVIWVSE